MSDIPEDVWIAVRAALSSAGIPSTEADYGNGTVFEVEAEVIARAIMAERERCAKLADALTKASTPGMPLFGAGMCNAADQIAIAIRAVTP